MTMSTPLLTVGLIAIALLIKAVEFASRFALILLVEVRRDRRRRA